MRHLMDGRASAVVLLHGQPGSPADWNGVVQALALAGHGAGGDAGGDGGEAIALPRPGWDGRRPATDLAGNAAAVLAELDRRRLGTAVVVGHSFGGAIAAWLGATHPGRVAALVLVAPAANAASLYPLDRWLATPVIAQCSAAISLGGLGLALAVPPVRRRLADSVGLDPEYLEGARRSMLRPGAWRSHAAEQRALVRQLPALERRLETISAPTTILSGSADRIVPPRAVRRLSDQIPGAELRVVPGAGHLLPQTRPEAIAAAVTATLRRVRASTLGGT